MFVKIGSDRYFSFDPSRTCTFALPKWSKIVGKFLNENMAIGTSCHIVVKDISITCGVKWSSIQNPWSRTYFARHFKASADEPCMHACFRTGPILFPPDPDAPRAKTRLERWDNNSFNINRYVCRHFFTSNAMFLHTLTNGRYEALSWISHCCKNYMLICLKSLIGIFSSIPQSIKSKCQHCFRNWWWRSPRGSTWIEELMPLNGCTFGSTKEIKRLVQTYRKGKKRLEKKRLSQLKS